MTSCIHVSPTERPSIVLPLRRLAADLPSPPDVEVTDRPEKMGVDFAWRANGSWHGCQRKELNDLIASLDDGRLSMELRQMKASIAMPVVVVEGRIAAVSGQVQTNGYGKRVSMSTLQQRLMTLAWEGVAVFYTSEPKTTAEWIVWYWQWTQRRDHTTGSSRPKPAGDWGKLTSREFQEHLLQGLPGVGPKTAAAMVDRLGRCPLVLDATVKELKGVPGVGEKSARRMLEAINGQQGTEERAS